MNSALQENLMSGTPTEIYRAANPQQAHLLKSLLEDEGISAWVDNENMQIAGGELPLGWTAAARVMVGESDAVEARRLAEEFDATTAHDITPEENAEPESTEWKDWPACPQCHERRQARCTVCGSSGTDFPLADIEEGAEQTKVLLICKSCDDHFRPEFYRHCHRCGHDFQDGIEIDSESAQIHAADGRRTILLMAGLLAGGVALLLYFAWVMR